MLMLVDGIRAVALRRTVASDSGGTLILVKTADGLVVINSGAAIFQPARSKARLCADCGTNLLK
jgi:hypothetical protein